MSPYIACIKVKILQQGQKATKYLTLGSRGRPPNGTSSKTKIFAIGADHCYAYGITTGNSKCVRSSNKDKRYKCYRDAVTMCFGFLGHGNRVRTGCTGDEKLL